MWAYQSCALTSVNLEALPRRLTCAPIQSGDLCRQCAGCVCCASSHRRHLCRTFVILRTLLCLPPCKLLMSHDDALFEELLIEKVKQHEHLWKISSNKYADVQKSHNSWEEISQSYQQVNINVSAEDCKKKWKYLRDNYAKKRKKEITQSADPFYKKQSWKYFERLTFLNEAITHRKLPVPVQTAINERAQLPTPEVDVPEQMEENSDELEIPVPPPKKRKANADKERQEIIECMQLWRERQQNEDDGLDAFGKHITGSLRNLGPEMASLVKLEIQKILFKYEQEKFSNSCMSRTTSSSIPECSTGDYFLKLPLSSDIS